MKHNLVSQFFRDDRGTAAIEFAVAITGFVAIIGAIVGAGLLFSIEGDLKKSMIAAERYALVHTETDEDLKAIMRSNLATYDGEQLTLNLSRATHNGVTFVKVVSGYQVNLVVNTFTLSSTRIFPT